MSNVNSCACVKRPHLFIILIFVSLHLLIYSIGKYCIDFFNCCIFIVVITFLILNGCHYVHKISSWSDWQEMSTSENGLKDPSFFFRIAMNHLES
jgi:hypothetical protein